MVGKESFVYGRAERGGLKVALSNDRFHRYATVCQDEVEALQLYTWNAAVASAFYGPLQTLEVTLRNSVNDRLARHYGEWWLRSSQLLRPGDRKMVQDAEDRVMRLGKPMDPGRVVAELSFAFWVGLFAKAYDQTLWRQHLFSAFYPRPTRSDVFGRLDRLRTLRNRIAHHEPIFQRKLLDDYDRITYVVERISPTVSRWMTTHSRVYEVLCQSHAETCRF